MADLGNLYFDVLLRDKTDAEAAKIKKKILDSLKAELDVTFDKTKLESQVKAAVGKLTGVVSVSISKIDDAALKTMLSKSYVVKLTAILDDIADALQKAIDKKKYTLPLDVKDIHTVVQSALSASGFTFTANPKIMVGTIQPALDASHGGKPYTIKVTVNTGELARDLKKYLNGRGPIKTTVVAYRNELLKSIHDALSTSHPFKINVVVDKASARQAVQDALRKVSAWNGKYTVDDLRAARGESAKLVAEARAAEAKAKAQLALARANQVAAKGAGLHAEASIRLGGAMGSNISIAGQLKDQFLSLYSIYAIENFLRNVIQIGGELEKQQLAMGAILHDTSQAAQISGQLKTLAVRSPFGVLDLNRFAKQLTAYSIPYNELYDTMKRLADISAGVGVDMGRIVLAFGQIRAAKFLKGTELRQLTEANIPMVDKLCERFSKLEGRIVSAAEVMDMISKKKVTFEDVKAVLWEMTGEGGMFYNMQENLAESVSAKWKNLGDAIDIMYGEIAEANAGLLKGTANTLTYLVKHWNSLRPAIDTALAGYAAFRLYSFTTNRLITKEVASMEQSILAAKKKEAQNMQLAESYRKLTVIERGAIASSNSLRAADLRAAVSSGQLTKEQVLRLVALKKLSVAQAGHLRQTLDISRAELQAAANANQWKLRMLALKQSIGNFFKGLWAFATNPFVLATMAIGAVMEAVNAMKMKADEAKQNIADMKEMAEEGYKNLSEVAIQFSSPNINPDKMNDGEFIQAIKTLKQKLKDYAPNWTNIFTEAFKTDAAGKQVYSLRQQFEILNQAVLDTKDAFELMSRSANVMSDSNDSTDGWLDDSFKENIKDYINAQRDVDKEVGRLLEYREEMTNAIARAIEADSRFAEAAQGKTLNEQTKLLSDYSTAFATAHKYLQDIYATEASYRITDDFGAAADKLKSVYENDLIPDLKKFVTQAKNLYIGLGYDFNNLSQAQEINIRKSVRAFLQQIEGMTQETQNELEKLILENEFGFKVVLDYEEAEIQLQEWQRQLDDLTNHEYTAIISVGVSFDDTIGDMKKEYKKAKETMESLDDILKKNGVTEIIIVTDDKGNPLMTSLEGAESDPLLQKIAIEYVAAKKIVDAKKELMDKYGISLEEDKKKGKGNGTPKDPIADALKERLKLLRDAYSEYKKWVDLIGEDAAMQKIKDSGMFDALFSGNEPVNLEQYANELQTLLAGLDTKTKGRRELRVEIQKLLLDMEADEKKKAADRLMKDVEAYISKASSNWSLYKEIFNATGDANLAQAAFGDYSMWNKAAMELKEHLAQLMEQRGLGIDVATLNWNMDATEAETLFGTNKDLLKLYQEIQKVIQDNGREYLRAGANAIKATQSIEGRIKTLENQRQSMIADYINNFGDEDFSSDFAAQIDVIDQQINKLKSDFFELLPIYEQIFGDMTYNSYGSVKNAENITNALITNAKAGPIGANGKPEYYTSFYMDNGQVQQVVLTRQQLERLKKQIDEFYKIKGDKNPFRNMLDALSNLKTVLKDDKAKPEEKAKAWAQFAQSFGDSAQMIGGFCSNLSSMFSALGNDATAQTMDDVGAAMESAANIGQAFAKGGLVGGIAAAASEAVGWIGRIAGAHDRKLDKTIDKSKLKYQQLQNVYDVVERALKHTLGSGADAKFDKAEDDIARLGEIQRKIAYINNQVNGQGFMDWISFNQLKNLREEQKTLEKRNKAYQEGGAYGYQRALMEEQLAELEKQRQAEIDKKKTDDKAVADYDAQISEMAQSIKDFAEETADTLYGINLKDWASQLGDALFDAWKRGEDGAEAFQKKATEIVGNVMNSILKLAILEPAMQQLQEMLFGPDGMSGMFGKDFTLDEGELESIADYLMGISSKTDDYYDMLDKLNGYMEAKYGMSLKEAEDSNGLSKGIQGVTESTADLLASYINAIRADVSLKREYVRKMVEELFPAYNIIAQAQLQQLEMIQINTARNVELVSEIRDIVSSNNNPGKGFKIA